DPGAKGPFGLVPVPGVLLELAEFARVPSHCSLLLIDEINRGNVSRVFGEFITLMEQSKRLAPSGQATADTVGVRLPYLSPAAELFVEGLPSPVPQPFTMPFDVYTLASMNSVDKSVAPLDSALRRRFHIFNLPAELSEIQNAFGLPANVDFEGI